MKVGRGIWSEMVVERDGVVGRDGECATYICVCILWLMGVDVL